MEPEIQFLSVVGLLALAIILTIIRNYFLYSICRLLKTKHPEKWESLGSPTSIMDMSPKKYLKISNFISTNEYMELKDETLNKRIALTKKIKLLFVWIFGFGVTVILIGFSISLFRST